MWWALAPACTCLLYTSGAGFVPDTLNTGIYDEILPVANEDAFATGKALAHEDGILVGISSGAAVFAATELAKRPENKGDVYKRQVPNGSEHRRKGVTLMEAILRVQGIQKHYPGFALEDVSFSLAPNRIMGLIGKNGAGKSTTLKAILNMVSPERGRVTLFGQDFYQHEKACKQRIGVVFGGIDFYPLKKLSAITAVTRKFYTNWDETQYQTYLKRFALEESKKCRCV